MGECVILMCSGFPLVVMGEWGRQNPPPHNIFSTKDFFFAIELRGGKENIEIFEWCKAE